jgi:hypothetical protein
VHVLVRLAILVDLLQVLDDELVTALYLAQEGFGVAAWRSRHLAFFAVAGGE